MVKFILVVPFDVIIHRRNYSYKIPEVCAQTARRAAGKQGAPAAGQSVTRRPTPRLPSISSISCSSSLAFHHQKYFRSVTQPATATSHSNARLVSLSVPLSRDLGRGEPQGSGLRTRAGARARGAEPAVLQSLAAHV